MVAREPMRRGVVILCGGRSRRMGRPKAWIAVDGVPLLRRVVDAARAAGDVHVVVVTASDLALPQLPEGVEIAIDPPERTGEGPLAAAVTGLERLHERGIATAYVGSGDAIGLSPTHVAFVLDRLQRSGAAAVVPVEHDVVHALAGAVRVADGLAAGRALLAEGERSVRAWLDALAASPIAVDELPDRDALRPCNTPADLGRAGDLR